MEEAIAKRYEQLEKENVDLMIDHLYKKEGTPHTKEMLINYTLLTKLGQMQRQFKSLN